MKENEKYEYIGKLDKEKLGKYNIINEDIVLTNERKKHIYQNHLNDFDKIIGNITNVILNPSEIIEDLKNKDTIFIIGKLDKDNLNVIVKLNTIEDKKHPKNSIMTAWIIRDKNLRKLRDKNRIIYKSE